MIVSPETRRCYVCSKRLSPSSFWRGKRICKTCQSAEYRKPEMLDGWLSVWNPVPHVEAKCLIAACTAAATLDGLCRWHDAKYRHPLETTPRCVECGAPLVAKSEKAVGACVECVGWWGKSVTGRSA